MMDARWLDRCWPLTKYVHSSNFYMWANVYLYIAHEPSARRYRGVQTRQTQGGKGISSSRRKQQLSSTRRVGREAYIGSDNRPRRSYYLSLRRISSARGSICTFGSKCARRRNCFISRCWCGYCKTCWTRSACWISGMFMVLT
jgi:hypothetical protein